MDFNFYDRFKNYSNTDLLTIIRRPDDYQPDAVEAATKILSDRDIAKEDIEQVTAYYNDTDRDEKSKADKINAYKNKAADFIEPITNPGTELKPEKWLHILLLIIGLQYVWTLFVNVSDIARFIKSVIDCKNYGFSLSSSQSVTYWTCFTNQFDIIIFSELLTLFYIPFIFYLLYKRKRWGWILLFADNLFGLISTVSESYIFFKYQEMHHGSTVSFLTHILIKGLFVFFLWKSSVADFFGLSDETKKNTALITSAISVAFIFGIQLFV